LKLTQTRAVFFFALAGFAGLATPGVSETLPVALMTTTLEQCEQQICGTFPALAGYGTAPLSGFAGTQTVGEGAFVTASGTPFPFINSEVPLSGANALLSADLDYFIEVVPLNGDTTVAPVQIGASGAGTISAATGAGQHGQNDAEDMVLQLALLSDSSGTPVFNDESVFQYSASLDNQDVCQIVHSESASGAGSLPTGTIGCGGSSVSGGINENGTYTISTNSVYEVVMNSTLQVGTGNDGDAHGPGTVQATAYRDPYFTAPAGYEILLSDGIGNVAPVPEPATWSMLLALVGLVGVAKLLRRSASGK
jgi:hypothetical protein